MATIVSRFLPRVFLLDLDDTILDDSSTVPACWRWACARHAVAEEGLDPEAVYQAITSASTWYWSDAERHRTGRLDLLAARRHVVALAFHTLGIDRPDMAAAIGDAYSEARDARMQPLPGAIDTLRWLRDHGCRLALLTNGAADAQRRKIDRFALAPWFDHILIEGELGFGKPDPRVFETALGRLGAAPSDAWMAGDNLEWDVAPARQMGIHAIWVDAGRRGVPAGWPHAPDRIVERLADLCDSTGPC